MDNNEKIELLKEHVRNERYRKEPIAHALISILVKKGIISDTERIQIQCEFDEYMDNQVDWYFEHLDEEYNPIKDD